MASQPTLKEWLVGILIPTHKCPSLGTVKNGKTLDFESSVEVLSALGGRVTVEPRTVILRNLASSAGIVCSVSMKKS